MRVFLGICIFGNIGGGGDYADPYRASAMALLSCIDAVAQSVGYIVEFLIIFGERKITQAHMRTHRDTYT